MGHINNNNGVTVSCGAYKGNTWIFVQNCGAYIHFPLMSSTVQSLNVLLWLLGYLTLVPARWKHPMGIMQIYANFMSQTHLLINISNQS